LDVNAIVCMCVLGGEREGRRREVVAVVVVVGMVTLVDGQDDEVRNDRIQQNTESNWVDPKIRQPELITLHRGTILR